MATRIAQTTSPTTRRKSEKFMHHFDLHPTAEDLMGESIAQSALIHYLVQVLQWLARSEKWFVATNLNLYRMKQRAEYPIAPDVALFKNVTLGNQALQSLRSWRLYEPNRPAPSVVFEISSDSTWEDDLAVKPARYALVGVEEYFAYDPNEPALWPAQYYRLRGWRLIDGSMVEQAKDAQGRLWSTTLDSWVVADGVYVRLYTADGQLRLTEGEAERQAKEVAWAKLREFGIDPEQL